MVVVVVVVKGVGWLGEVWWWFRVLIQMTNKRVLILFLLNLKFFMCSLRDQLKFSFVASGQRYMTLSFSEQ